MTDKPAGEALIGSSDEVMIEHIRRHAMDFRCDISAGPIIKSCPCDSTYVFFCPDCLGAVFLGLDPDRPICEHGAPFVPAPTDLDS